MSTDLAYRLTATANCCGFSGTLKAIELHSCDVEEFGGQCEDYPCCGHTDGLGCQTTPEMTREYYLDGPGREHLMCDHEAGFCDTWDDEPDAEDEDDDDEPDLDGFPIE